MPSLLLCCTLAAAWCRFNELLPKYGGKAVSEEYFREKISGGHNPVRAAMRWPDKSEVRYLARVLQLPCLL